MAGRALVCCVLLTAGLAHAEREYAFGGPWPTPIVPPPPPRFAAGSVVGPWAWTELGGFLGAGTFMNPELYSQGGVWTDLSAGWGFQAGPVQLRPSARFSLAAAATSPDSATGSRVSFTPVMLSLAAPNLLDELRSGLRLTPAVGLTIPTSVGRSVPLTTLSVALQLERRFGPVELALRSEVGKPLYVAMATSTCFVCPIEAQPNVNWTWGNSLQGEGWITESLSLGLSLAWNIAWGFPLPALGDEFSSPLPSRPTVATRHGTTGRVFVSWAFTRLFGLSFEVNTTQPAFTPTGSLRFPFLSFGAWAENRTVLFLSLWFRTDATLARNWIER